MRKLALLLTVVVLGCGGSGYREIPDVSTVTLNFAQCDSSWSMFGCAGPTHPANSETFTVIISRQAVLRHHVYGFHACTVYSPRDWVCLDTGNKPVALKPDGVMLWDELANAKQVLVR